ncbi:UNVERIFIED_CONTAM: hypothetical protein Slati_1503700 [Sesamum latifolium]|uniref:Endonuclease/exonuclease/phosphatase domain-containing protein n=1 Tax=Sesamum latifolium TaxID=2727402 RepID=A0AAW2X6H7_9LAMI
MMMSKLMTRLSQWRRLQGDPAAAYDRFIVELSGDRAPWTVQSLRDMVRSLNPDLVFLMETKCKSHRIDSIKKMLDMHGLAVDSVGRSGGLALLWKKSVSVTIQSFSNRHIDASIQADTRSPISRFSGIYGDPETSNRKNTWELLTRLKAQSIRPWLCMGDFNEILEDSEKEGGNTRPTWQMRDFRHALDLNGLFDLGFNGDPFTWSNRQEFPNTIRERLDRACADDNWIKLFPNAQVTHS